MLISFYLTKTNNLTLIQQPKQAGWADVERTIFQKKMFDNTFVTSAYFNHYVKSHGYLCNISTRSKTSILHHLCSSIITSNDRQFDCPIINMNTIHNAILFIDTSTMRDTIKGNKGPF